MTISIVLAGLAFQVFTMLVFIICSLEFGRRARARYRKEARGELPVTPGCAALRRSAWRKTFLGALAFSTVCIFARCAYRVAELSGGWRGPLARSRVLFILLEGALVLLASFAMVALHPAWTFCPLDEDEDEDEEGQDVGNPRRPFDTERLCAPCLWFRAGWRSVTSRRRSAQPSDHVVSGNNSVHEMVQSVGKDQEQSTVPAAGDGTADALPSASTVATGGNMNETRDKTHVKPKPKSAPEGSPPGVSSAGPSTA